MQYKVWSILRFGIKKVHGFSAIVAALAITFAGIVPAHATHLRGAVGFVKYDTAAKTVTVNSTMVERKDACTVTTNQSSAAGNPMPTSGLCTFFGFPTITAVDPTTGAQTTVSPCPSQATTPSSWSFDYTSQPLYNIFNTVYVINVNCPSFNPNLDYIFGQTGSNRIGGIKNTTNQVIQFEGRVKLNASHTTPIYNTGYMTNVAYDPDPTHTFTTNLNALDEFGKGVTYSLITSSAAALGGYGATAIPCSTLNTTTGEFKVSASLCTAGQSYSAAFSGGTATTPIYYALKTKATDATGQYVTRDVLLSFVGTTNVAPIVSADQSVSFSSNSGIQYVTVSARDTNNTAVTFSTNTLPSWATLLTSGTNPATATIRIDTTGVTGAAQVIQVSATDNDAFPLSATSNLTITIGSGALPPAAPTIDPVNTTGDGTANTISLRFAKATSGGAVSQYTITARPNNGGAAIVLSYSNSGAGPFTVSIPGTTVGVYYTITVTAYNSMGSADSQPYSPAAATLTVSPTALSFQANTAIGSNLLTYTASPANTSYSASTTVPGLTFNTTTGQFSGTPTTSGTYTVTITGSNGASVTVTITVLAKQSQTITFPQPGVVPMYATGTGSAPTSSITLGTVRTYTVRLAAYSTSGLPISYSLSSGGTAVTAATAQSSITSVSQKSKNKNSNGEKCFLSSDGTYVYAGAWYYTSSPQADTCTLYAAQAGNSSYSSATTKTVTLYIAYATAMATSPTFMIRGATTTTPRYTYYVGDAVSHPYSLCLQTGTGSNASCVTTPSNSTSPINWAFNTCAYTSVLESATSTTRALPTGLTLDIGTNCELSGIADSELPSTLVTLTLGNPAGTQNGATSSPKLQFYITVIKRTQKVTSFSSPGTMQLGATTSQTLRGTSDSGNTVMFRVTSGGTNCVMSTDNRTVILAAGASAGTCTVEAFLTGDTRYYPSASVDNLSQTITILAANLAPTLNLNAAQSATIPALSTQTDLFPITASNSAVTVWTIVDPSGNRDALAVPDGMSFDTSTGQFGGMPEGAQDYITYQIGGRNSAGQWSNTITVRLKITQLTQNLLFDTLASMVSGDSRTLSARADSGLLVTFTSLNPAICVINANGTVTAISAGTCSIRADQAGNGKSWAAAPSVTQNISVALALLPPNISLSSTSAVVQAGEYLLPLYTIANSGGDLGVDGVADVFTLDARYTTTLPPGVTFNTKWGVFEGRPTTTASAQTYGVKACNAAGCSTATFTLTVAKKQQIITITPASSSLLAPRTMSVTASSSAGSGYVVSLQVAPASAGICSLSNGVLTAIAMGACVLNASVSGDNIYDPATDSTTVTITQAPALTVTGTNGVTGTSAVMNIWDSGIAANQRYTLTFTGTPDARTTYSLFDANGNDLTSVGTQGLSFDSTSGLLSGVVNWQNGTAAAATYTVRVSNQYGSASVRVFLNIMYLDVLSGSYGNDQTPAVISTLAVTPAPNGTAISSITISATGASSGFTYSVAPGSALPAGLSLNQTTGVISGTPTANGTFVTLLTASYLGVQSFTIELDTVVTGTVSLNSNGGTGTMTASGALNLGDSYAVPSSTFTAPSGKVILVPAWNTAADGSGTSYAAGTTLTLGSSNVVLYAQWGSASAKTVTFNSNYPVGNSVDSRTQTVAGVSTQLRSNTFAIPGFTFQGWGTTASTTTVRYINGAPYGFTADLSLYAIWSASALSISARSNPVTTLTTRTATISGSLYNGIALSSSDVSSIYLCSGDGVTAGNVLTGNVRCSSNEWTSSSSLAAGATLTFNEVAGNLTANTTYYEQLKVNFANGTSISSTARAFTTNANPVATTLAPVSVASTQATIQGKVNPEANKLTRVYFCWGTDAMAVANCTRTSDITQSVWWNGGTTGDQQFTLTLSNLSPGTTYYYKVLTDADDNNGLGTFAFHPHKMASTTGGSTVSFTTPSATTSTPATGITGSGATVSGTLNGGTNGLTGTDVTSAKFCYSLSSAVDATGALSFAPVCGTNLWNSSLSVAANGSLPFSTSLTGLSSSTQYYFQFQVTFASGSPATAYGAVQSFTTQSVITFHSNPPAIVVGGVDNTSTQNVPGSVTLNSNPFSFTGLTFDHWTTNANGTGTSYLNGSNLTTSLDVDLYAQWTTNNYQVGFDAGAGTWASGTQLATVTARYGSTITTPSSTEVVRSGYNFAGWSVGGSTYGALQNYTVPAANSVLVATWTPMTYSIQFNLNNSGGTTPSTQYYVVGGTGLTLPSGTGLTPPAGMSGYTFGGWTTTPGGSSAVSSPYVPGGSLTLYPVWVAPGSISITYHSNYPAGVNSTASQSGSIGTFTVRDASTFSYTGWAIDHWVDATNSANTYALGASVYFTGNTDLNAVWTQLSYTLSYDVRGGTWSGAAPAVATLHYGDLVSTTARPTEPTGYTFTGWNDGAATYAALVNYTMPAANTVLVAQYSLNQYQVTFDARGGSWLSGDPSGAKGYGSVLTLPTSADVRYTGYTLLGWTIGGVDYNPGASYTLGAAGVNITARWQSAAISITYNSAYPAGSGLNDASAVDNVTPGSVQLNHTFTAPTGYHFVKWTTGSVDYNNLDNYSGFTNLNLTAVWALTNYTLSYSAGSGAFVGSTPLNQSLTYNASVSTEARGIVSQTGYHFVDWSYTVAGVSSTVLDAANFTMPAADVVLVAQFAINSYTVSYGLGGGSWVTTDPSGSYTYGTVLALPGTTDVRRTGYTLGGWLVNGVTYSACSSFTLGAGNTNITPIWTPDVYTVSFDMNGGTSAEAPLSQQFTVGTSGLSLDVRAFTAPSTASSSTFGGWATSSTSTSAVSSSAFQPTADTVLYAIWVAPGSFTITYQSNYPAGSGSTDTTNTQVGSGASVALAGSFTAPTGYALAYWADATNPASTFDARATYTANAPITLNAVWTQLSYNLSYDAGLGSFTGSAPANQSLHYGDVITTEARASVTKVGYSFSGWFYSENGGTAQVADATAFAMHAHDITLTARYSINSYNVSYSSNSGSWTSSNPSGSQVYNTVVTLPSSTDVHRSGYTLAGWLIGGNTSVNAGSSYTVGAGDVSIEARWVGNTYTVSFRMNGGTATSTPADANFTVGTSSPVHLPIAGELGTVAAPNAGFHFAGWSETSGGSSPLTGGYSPVTDTVLYAIWAAPATVMVRFDSNGGAFSGADPSGSQNYNSAIALPGSTDATRVGYTLLGWSANGVNYSLGAFFTVPATDVTLTARWQNNSTPAAANHTVTFYSNYAASTGRTNGSYSQSSNTTGSLATPFGAAAGYSFAGWATSPTGAVVYTDGASYGFASDLTLYAIWRNLGHVLTLHGNLPSGDPTVTQVGTSAGSILANPWTNGSLNFAGWNTAANGSGQSYAAGANYDFNADLSLYAQWSTVVVTPPTPSVDVRPTVDTRPTIDTRPTQDTRPSTDVRPDPSKLPPIAPIPVPVPDPGTAITSVAGKPVDAVSAPNADGTKVNIISSGWNLELAVQNLAGVAAPLDEKSRVTLSDGQYAHTSGTGFLPNSEVHIYVFSTPILLGIAMTDANGNFTAAFPIPAGLQVGDHIVQVDGYSPAGTIRSASIPAVVQPAVGKVLHAVFYFSPDSAKISAKAAKAIKALAAKVKQTKGYTSLNVGTMGFVYPYDTAANNLKVSTARAKNVAALLKAAGLKGLFVATGKGRAAQKNSKARRVELTISYQLPPKVGG